MPAFPLRFGRNRPERLLVAKQRVDDEGMTAFDPMGTGVR
jgi:hypothetical protein